MDCNNPSSLDWVFLLSVAVAKTRTTSIIAGAKAGMPRTGKKGVDPTTGGPKPPNVGGFGKRDVYQHFTTKDIPWCCRQTIKNTNTLGAQSRVGAGPRRRARTLQNLWSVRKIDMIIFGGSSSHV